MCHALQNVSKVLKSSFFLLQLYKLNFLHASYVLLVKYLLLKEHRCYSVCFKKM